MVISKVTESPHAQTPCDQSSRFSLFCGSDWSCVMIIDFSVCIRKDGIS